MVLFIMTGKAQRLRQRPAGSLVGQGEHALVEGRVFEIQLLALFQLAAKEAWVSCASAAVRPGPWPSNAADFTDQYSPTVGGGLLPMAVVQSAHS